MSGLLFILHETNHLGSLQNELILAYILTNLSIPPIEIDLDIYLVFCKEYKWGVW